jgi:hypothetical protein
MKYEIVEKPKGELSDYEIRIEGAGKGSPKIATVWGHYGTDAKATADEIVAALNRGIA